MINVVRGLVKTTQVGNRAWNKPSLLGPPSRESGLSRLPENVVIPDEILCKIMGTTLKKKKDS